MLYLFGPVSLTDTGKTAQGELYVKDSPRNWNSFTNSIEAVFQDELRGEEFWYQGTDPNMPKTWSEKCRDTIRRISSGVPVLYENPERLINYIHRRRAELGLPPVDGNMSE